MKSTGVNHIQPQRGAGDWQVGDQASLVRTLDQSDVMAYANLTGDFGALHMDADFARQTRYGQPVVHPMLLGGMINAVINNHLPGAVCLNHYLEFLAPVFVGDTVTARVEVTRIQAENHLIQLKTACHNQADRPVVTGQVVVMILKEVT